MTDHVDPPNATVLPAARRGEKPVLPPGTEPTTGHLREALDACVDLAGEVAQLRLRLDRAERERDQFRDNYVRDAAALDKARDDLARVEVERDDARAELTAARGRIVDLLYIIDAFQIESGADRNASYETGIAAVRQLRSELDTARAELEQLRAQLHPNPESKES